MIELKVVGNTITCIRTETIVQGQSETVFARVTLNSAWDSYAPLVAWRANGVERASAIADGMTTVPWEVLQVATVLEVAVAGTLGAAVLSTPYISVGQIVPGPAPNVLESAAPTPSVHEQLVRLSYEALERAKMALEEAEDAVERVEQAAEEIEAAPLIRDEIAQLAELAKQAAERAAEAAAEAEQAAQLPERVPQLFLGEEKPTVAGPWIWMQPIRTREVGVEAAVLELSTDEPQDGDVVAVIDGVAYTVENASTDLNRVEEGEFLFNINQ